MRKIVLHAPQVDRKGGYRDAGDTLTVGAEDAHDTDLTTSVADELIEKGRAVTITTARAQGSIDTPAVDPLDHDANGRKGGAAKASA